MAAVTSLPFTGDEEADRLLATDPLALVIGMLLDQQVPLERAFHAPYELKERLGGRLDATAIAAMDPDELRRIFAERPALHRFPGSMAGRVQALCRALVECFGGAADRVWKDAATGEELFANLRSLPGFGEQKAQIFTALLAKRLGVAPPGWEEHAGFFASHDAHSVADIDSAEAIAQVRENKRAMKAAARAKR